MRILGLDFGSSSVKGAILEGTRVVGRMVREEFATRYDGVRAEVDAREILRAMGRVIGGLGGRVRKVDAIALAVMSPAWVAMDRRGRAITPVVTHQDRRSEAIARELERRLGKSRWLKLAGNRPVPGGITCTTWAWFLKHEPAIMKRADLCGHLNTFLHRQLTSARIIDPSNASFTGLYSTATQRGWNDTLIEATGISRHQLPQVIGSDAVGGLIDRAAAQRLGLTHGTPVLAGIVDTSAAMLLAGARAGQLVNVCGSTDVLGLCTDSARPHERLITRALGVGKKWMSVATIAAGGSTLAWAKNVLFADCSEGAFWKRVGEIAARKPESSAVRFEPYLAGERTILEQRRAEFTGLTLSTTRQEMLGAILEALVRISAERIDLLASLGTPLRRRVMVSGGAEDLCRIMQRHWPGTWTFRREEEASLRGLGKLVE